MCPCDYVICEYHASFLDTGSMRWEETSACSSRVLLGQPIAVVSYLFASGVLSQGCMGPARLSNSINDSGISLASVLMPMCTQLGHTDPNLCACGSRHPKVKISTLYRCLSLASYDSSNVK